MSRNPSQQKMSDDEIEVLDELPNYGGGGGGERSGGWGAKDRFRRNNRYHFIFSNSIPEDERRDLFTKIKALGGRAPFSTHEKQPTVWYPTTLPGLV